MAVTAPTAPAITHHIPRRTTPSRMLAFERPLAGEPVAKRPVRLTRRGRVVVLLTLLTLLLLAFTIGRVGNSQAATHRPGASAPSHVYVQTTVHQGESLWAVARRVAPGQDPRSVVLKIRELNPLSSGAVQAGQQLVLPA